MVQISPMCKLKPSEIANLGKATALELTEELDDDAKRSYAFQKCQLFKEKSGMRSAILRLRKVEAILGRTFATNEQYKIIKEERRIWLQNFTVHARVRHEDKAAKEKELFLECLKQFWVVF